MSITATRTAPIVLLLFFLSCAFLGTKKESVDLISIEEEIRIGQKTADEISRQIKLIDDEEIENYFQLVGRGIADNSDWSGLAYKFYILNTAEFLAFSISGGHVYISKGLIEQADNLGEVACLMAHEIGHIVSRDGTRQLMKVYGMAVSAQSILGDNPNLYSDIVAQLFQPESVLDYGEERELRATERAVRYSWKAGYDPYTLVSILEKLQLLETEDVSAVAKYQLTHPRVDKRIKRAMQTISKLPFKAGLRSDAAEFLEMKRRLVVIK